MPARDAIRPARAASRSNLTSDELEAVQRRLSKKRARRGKMRRGSSTLGLDDLKGIRTLRELDKV